MRLVPCETAKPMALWLHRWRHLMQAGKWARNREAGRAGQESTRRYLMEKSHSELVNKESYITLIQCAHIVARKASSPNRRLLYFEKIGSSVVLHQVKVSHGAQPISSRLHHPHVSSIPAPLTLPRRGAQLLSCSAEWLRREGAFGSPQGSSQNHRRTAREIARKRKGTNTLNLFLQPEPEWKAPDATAARRERQRPQPDVPKASRGHRGPHYQGCCCSASAAPRPE